ncbi:MAG: hypothetical protein PHP23_11850 [Desulfobacterales bacterium]|nr:hypothetical protein [Desulfobacterales bacterium]MDD4072474.1 hypothetical protein [Desulfobacterales bacterium]MDD4392559.1 hypothetical protein [Desulfobacterales bacterium]
MLLGKKRSVPISVDPWRKKRPQKDTVTGEMGNNIEGKREVTHQLDSKFRMLLTGSRSCHAI